MEKLELLEHELSTELRHTLKLVPSSQRELFVSELAKFTAERDKRKLMDEHRKISNLFANDDLLKLSTATKLRLKARFQEIKESWENITKNRYYLYARFWISRDGITRLSRTQPGR